MEIRMSLGFLIKDLRLCLPVEAVEITDIDPSFKAFLVCSFQSSVRIKLLMVLSHLSGCGQIIYFLDFLLHLYLAYLAASSNGTLQRPAARRVPGKERHLNEETILRITGIALLVIVGLRFIAHEIHNLLKEIRSPHEK